MGEMNRNRSEMPAKFTLYPEMNKCIIYCLFHKVQIMATFQPQLRSTLLLNNTWRWNMIQACIEIKVAVNINEDSVRI